MAKQGGAVPALVRHDGWTARRRAKFLDVLASTANVTAATKAVGKSKSTVYELRKRDAEFARAWDAAIDIAMDELEAIAFDRVVNGVQKIIMRSGQAPVTITEYSDRLLMFMMSRHRPQRYADLAASRGMEREHGICDEIEARIIALNIRKVKAD